MGCNESKPDPVHEFQPHAMGSQSEQEEEQPQYRSGVAPGDKQQQTVQVECPPDAAPGTVLQVSAPDGTLLEVTVPEGVAEGDSFAVQYTPVAVDATNATNARATNATRMTNAILSSNMSKRLISKATKVTVASTGKSPEEWYSTMKEMAARETAEWRGKLTQQMDAALTSCNDTRLNQLLDSAVAGSMMREGAPSSVQRAANHISSRQLKGAIASEDPKQLKGALVAARRLNATEVPEFALAAQKYKEVKKLPPGFDVERMVIHLKKGKLVTKSAVLEGEIKARFQKLLDLTYRKVYTRDRLGQAVPDRLELDSVTVVTNSDLWGNYMARRETIRQELEKDRKEFVEYSVDTCAKAGDEGGESTEDISAALAGDFMEPLMPSVNEAFLFHGTSAVAADKIATADFNISLAGTSAGTLYGRGVYFAENSTKSDEYTRPMPNGLRHMLLCRVALGRMHYTDTKETDARACEAACLRGRFHAVLGDRKKCRGTFREFIVFDEEQIYPNYIIAYRRVDGKVDAARSMEVVCPAGAAPGKTLQVKTPDGVTIHIMVPPGVSKGQKFSVQY